MICYKDRSYCPFYLLCSAGFKCDRALTPDIKQAAINAELPISQFAEFPGCFVRLWEGIEDTREK